MSAKCTEVGRRGLWEALEEIKVCDSPLLVAGNFNVISYSKDHSRGFPPNVCNMEEFNEAIFSCGLSAVDFAGQPFTLTSGSLWQKLDQAL